jgi:hypothetical protein
MGMRIGGSGSAGAAQGAGAANWQQRQQGVKDLMAALKAGDLGSAQKAFSSLPGAGSAANANSPLGKIGQALQAGDLSAAQQAAQTWQAARNSGHHHHEEQAVAASPATTPPAAAGVGAFVNLTA